MEQTSAAAVEIVHKSEVGVIFLVLAPLIKPLGIL